MELSVPWQMAEGFWQPLTKPLIKATFAEVADTKLLKENLELLSEDNAEPSLEILASVLPHQHATVEPFCKKI